MPKNDKENTMDIVDELNSVEEEQIPTVSIDEIARKAFEEYEQERNRPKVVDTHFRTTVMLRNDLNDRLDDLCYKKKGLKNKLFNIAIQAILDSGVAQEQADKFTKEQNLRKNYEKKLNRLR